MTSVRSATGREAAWTPAEFFNQPKDYVPGRSSFEPDECLFMSEDTWVSSGDAAVSLPAPYRLKSTMFGCNTTDAVVDVAKDGRRHALYQYVRGFSVSADGRTMFLSNERELPGGRREPFVGLVDIPSKAKRPLPRLGCVPQSETSELGKARFFGDRLLTYSERGRDGDWTEVCVWDRDGKMLRRLEARLHWAAASVMVMPDQIGLLPAEPDVFFAYSALGGKECRLWLQDMGAPARSVSVQLLPTEGDSRCGGLELDLASARLGGGVVRFREPPKAGRDSAWKILAVPPVR